MSHRVLFLTLRVFSATGGIEKVCRIAGKALYELGLQYGGLVNVLALHGERDDGNANKYFPQLVFTPFEGDRVSFVRKAIAEGRRSKVVLMSHINLLVVGYFIKLFRPSVKLVLLAHGIEVWTALPGWKKKMLRKCDLILPVSHFTKDKMQALYGLPDKKFSVLNNCLDPFLELPLQKEKKDDLLERYGLKKEQIILLTVSRMSGMEQYKGYDKVLEALPELVKTTPGLRYLLLGEYDSSEKRRLDSIIRELGLEDVVIFTGFVAEEELAAHFKLGDIFIMPSEREGFGIVFIEAMFYGIPVVAGNIDGSVDALCNGELGLMVNPYNVKEIITAVKKIISNRSGHLPDPKKLEQQFDYKGYKEKLRAAVWVL
ncbi:MAG TPA: glycosyltransferase family 4 protein [Chitinophagaceae bacterium]|nr:glycosyltransferase family 4 protein [Chitinophagaceae bacterium]